jgi:hypothetical protein
MGKEEAMLPVLKVMASGRKVPCACKFGADISHILNTVKNNRKSVGFFIRGSLQAAKV